MKIILFKKNLIEWASFYNGIAHGLAVLGFESFTHHSINRLTKGKKNIVSKCLNEKKKLTSTSMNSLWENYCNTAGEEDQSWPQQRRFGSATFRKSLHSQRRTSIETSTSVGATGGSGRRRQSNF